MHRICQILIKTDCTGTDKCSEVAFPDSDQPTKIFGLAINVTGEQEMH